MLRRNPEPGIPSARQGTPHLHSGAFTTSRSAKEVGQQRRQQNHGGHSDRHPASRFMDFIQYQVSPSLGAIAPTTVNPKYPGTDQRQEKKDPRMGKPKARDSVQ